MLRTLGRFTFLLLLLAGGSLPVFAADHLDAIRKSGVLRWGGDAEGGAPYVYPDPNKPEQLTGFEHDLADALAAKLGVKAMMVQNEWDQLIPGLERGNFDIILNGLELTPEHQQHIAMSRPYYVYSQQIVLAKDSPELTQIEQLKGKSVGVLSDSVAQRLLQKMGGVDVRIYPGNVESFMDLKAGRIQATLLDLPIAIYYAKSDAALKFSGEPFAPGYYGIGIRKEDFSLQVALNEAIEELYQDHTLEKIYRKYGVWDDQQLRLPDYRPDVVKQQKSISTIREWPKYLPLLLRGAVTTVELSILGMVVAVTVGLFLVLARMYGIAPLRWLAIAYIEVIRGTPLLIQLFMIYYGLPEIGIKLNAFFAGVLGLGLNYAASEAENYRAGIQAIPRGQTEAAQALGMNRPQILRHIILPQA
ncbi:MAG TPA: ABC transporter substrate-binding protein/permease, partial [Verrucomicrobiae bacterium]|nr:ABC transporter substrate-binding protein/permease [Verrucomicrobiae bacterium]